MTTRATLADGSTFDIDEETEAKFTHLNDQAVVSWAFVEPTPEGWKRDEHGNAPGAAKAEPEAEAEPAVDETAPAGTK